MARINNLSNFLTDVANSIRTKKGTTETIKAEDFDTEIENLPSGGGDISEYFDEQIKKGMTSSYGYYPGWLLTIKKLPYPEYEITNKDASYMFYLYTLEETPKLLNTQILTNCRNMFSTSYYLKRINLTSFNTSNVTDMSYMFYKCIYVTNLDLSSFNTSNVINMSNMFSDCLNLKQIDLSSFDFSKVTSMSYMFNNCTNELTNINFGSSTAPVLSNFDSMFGRCKQLKKIDLTFITSNKMRNMSYFCFECNLLEEIDLSSIDLTLITSFSNAFSYCGSKLPTGELTKVYVKNEACQEWVLTKANGHPTTWSTANVIIAGSEQDLRGE